MVSMRYYGVLALVFVAPAAAMRVRPSTTELLEKRTKATIGGVPVLNYHLAYQGKSYRHAIHRSSASLASLEIDPKEEDWVIVLNTDIAEEKIHEACRQATATCTIEGHASGRGFPFIALHGTEAELEQVLLATGGARFVEVDIPIRMIPEIQDINMETANSHNGEASKMANGGVAKSDTWWHLQKIGAPLRAHTGKGVHVFVLDTGVLTTHLDFEGRAKPFAETVGDGWGGSPKGLCQKFNYPCAADREGHGTHCAGTVGGATLGVAPGASLYAVKVLDDTGRGPTSAIVSGMDLAASSGHRPAVLSMSLGYTGSDSREDRAMLEAVTMVVSQGLTVVVAAGNEFGDACDGVLAVSPDAITVGATTSDNARASFSNFGTCVDIFAPGQDIRSASVDRAHVAFGFGEQDLSATTSLSGTSMACPAVAGAAALLLEATPKLTPEEVRKNLLANAGSNYINNLSPMDTTNNKLLYVGSDAPQTALSKPPADTKPWPTPDYWSACQGQFALGPVDVLGGSDFAEHHCECAPPATCSTPHGGACPLSKAFSKAVQPMRRKVVGMFFVWTCTDCACQNSGSFATTTTTTGQNSGSFATTTTTTGQNSGSFATTLHWIAAVIALHVVAVVGA